MDNRIRQIEVRDRSLVPAEAEVWITVTPEQPAPSAEVRGRLMGPRCPFAATVEVAYPLRPLPALPGLSVRVLIPEACLWEPECPFLYQGPVELWQEGRRCDRVTLSHGLRSFQFGRRGLRVNGRPLALRGRDVMDCSDEDARGLRLAGYNLLVAPVARETLPLWERADRLGFLMLGRVSEGSESTLRHLEALSGHASCLGWIVEKLGDSFVERLPTGGLLGLASDTPPEGPALSRVHFLIGPSELAELGKPLLVTGQAPEGLPETSVVLGYVA